MEKVEIRYGDTAVGRINRERIEDEFVLPIVATEDVRSCLSRSVGRVCVIKSWSWDMETNDASITVAPDDGVDWKSVLKDTDGREHGR